MEQLFKNSSRACLKTLGLYNKELAKPFDKNYKWYVLYSENFRDLLTLIYKYIKIADNLCFRVPAILTDQRYDNDVLAYNVPCILGYAFIGVGKEKMTEKDSDILKRFMPFFVPGAPYLHSLDYKELTAFYTSVKAFSVAKNRKLRRYMVGQKRTISQGPFYGTRGVLTKVGKRYCYLKYKKFGKVFNIKIAKEGIE